MISEQVGGGVYEKTTTSQITGQVGLGHRLQNMKK